MWSKKFIIEILYNKLYDQNKRKKNLPITKTKSCFILKYIIIFVYSTAFNKIVLSYVKFKYIDVRTNYLTKDERKDFEKT